MRKAAAISAWSICGILAIGLVAFIVPFIGFGGGYAKVCSDAAFLYDLDINDYKVKYQKTVRNRDGEKVQGLFRVEKDEATIFIQTGWSRPMVIATIFHEFAHAAQYKHQLDTGKFNIEQHAEILSFYKMWHSGYRWNAIHLLPMHMIGKSAEYRATGEIARMMFVNANPLDA